MVCLWNTMPPVATAILGQSQCHKVIDFGVIWKGVISGICIPNMKCLSLNVQKLKQRLELTTDRQTNRQDKNNMPPIIRSVST